MSPRVWLPLVFTLWASGEFPRVSGVWQAIDEMWEHKSDRVTDPGGLCDLPSLWGTSRDTQLSQHRTGPSGSSQAE